MIEATKRTAFSHTIVEIVEAVDRARSSLVVFKTPLTFDTNVERRCYSLHPPLPPCPDPLPLILPFCANRAEITVRFNSKERLYITVFTRGRRTYLVKTYDMERRSVETAIAARESISSARTMILARFLSSTARKSFLY